jgi:hypothetical protein
MRLHPSLTLERITDGARAAMFDRGDSYGACVECGADAYAFVEPDAERYPCEECGARGVYGWEALLFRVVP